MRLFMKNRLSPYPTPGVSLLEYVLPLALLLLVALPVLMSTSQGVGKQIKGVFATQSPSTPAQTTAVLAALPTTPVADIPVTGVSITLTLSGGQKLSLDNYPMDMAQLVETAGASGTSTVLANLLMAYGQQLTAKGRITTKQGNMIQQLANKAHKMADMQLAAETLAKQLQLDSAHLPDQWLNNKSIRYDGVTYQSSFAFVELFDVTSGTDAQGLQNAGPVLKDFFALQKQLTDGGLDWTTPEGQFFQHLSANIISTVDGTANSWFALNHITLWDNDNPLATDQASKTTHGDAAGVCGVGSGQDTGVQCNPA
jgi:hypothetical protein